MTGKHVAPLISTSGAGYIYEYTLGAIMLVHLLKHSHPPGLQVPVVEVGLNQHVLGHLLDDIVVRGESGRLCEFQVKRTVTVTASDGEFVDFLIQALQTLEDRKDEVLRGDLVLGLIAEGQARPLDELKGLARTARAHSKHDSFFRVFAPGAVGGERRTRLEHVQNAVQRAMDRGAPNFGDVDITTHRFLRALQVWHAEVSDNGRDLRSALSDLEPVAEEFGETSGNLFARLVEIVQELVVDAGDVDAEEVRVNLRRRGLRERSADAPAVVTAKIDADAVVRGPIDSLGLRHEVDHAEDLLARRDPAAPDAFASIAKQLNEKHFGPHAMIMLRRRADALEVVGRVGEAMLTRVGMAWDELDGSPTFDGALLALGGFPHSGDAPMPESTERAYWVAYTAIRPGGSGELTEPLARFDALEQGDPYRGHAAVFLAENAIAANKLDAVLDRTDVFRSIALEAARGPEESTRLQAVRLGMCLADATGEWKELLREAQRRYAPPIKAWVRARCARYLALSGDGPEAEAKYLRAIEIASNSEMMEEAAEWLYALRAARWLYGRAGAGEDPEEHPLAQALRPHARPSALPGSQHTAELALTALADESRPEEALERCYRWRWQSVIRAQLADELIVLRTIGSLLERREDILPAIESFVRANSAEKASAAARHLPDSRTHIDQDLWTPVPMRRAAVYSAAAAAADLLDDDEALAWCKKAIDEITDPDTDKPRTHGAPALRAFDVLGSMCEVKPAEEADALLQLLDPIIDRPANVAWESDLATAQILLALASRPLAVPMLARAIVADQRMARIITSRRDILVAHRDVLAQLLAPFAAENQYACLAIVRSGADPAPVVQLARKEVEQELAPQPSDQHHGPHMGAPEIGTLATILDDETRTRFATTMLERALDQDRDNVSRWHDLAALFNISTNIDGAVKGLLLPGVMEIASGQRVGDRLMFPDIDLGLTTMALRCAAKLDPDPNMCREIESIGLMHLRAAEENVQWEVTQALAFLPPEKSHLDLGQFSVHPIAALRALAGIRWAKDPSVLPFERAQQLARDPDYQVRRGLAQTLQSSDAPITDEAREIIAILRQDVRRSVRTPALQAVV
jgi:tetratricopeptide (TPR) repeat protein